MYRCVFDFAVPESFNGFLQGHVVLFYDVMVIPSIKSMASLWKFLKGNKNISHKEKVRF